MAIPITFFWRHGTWFGLVAEYYIRRDGRFFEEAADSAGEADQESALSRICYHLSRRGVPKKLGKARQEGLSVEWRNKVECKVRFALGICYHLLGVK